MTENRWIKLTDVSGKTWTVQIPEDERIKTEATGFTVHYSDGRQQTFFMRNIVCIEDHA